MKKVISLLTVIIVLFVIAMFYSSVNAETNSNWVNIISGRPTRSSLFRIDGLRYSKTYHSYGGY